jgi:hypothetical protein
MSKFKECNSVIAHYKHNKKYIELDTNLYVFSEAQSTGSPSHYDVTTWQWGNKTIVIQEVGIHPNIE